MSEVGSLNGLTLNKITKSLTKVYQYKRCTLLLYKESGERSQLNKYWHIGT